MSVDCRLQLSAWHCNNGGAGQVLSAGDRWSATWYYNTVRQFSVQARHKSGSQGNQVIVLLFMWNYWLI